MIQNFSQNKMLFGFFFFSNVYLNYLSKEEGCDGFIASELALFICPAKSLKVWEKVRIAQKIK